MNQLTMQITTKTAKAPDLTGQRFGTLVAGEKTTHKGRPAYVMHCDCGVTKVMRRDVLVGSGRVLTCKTKGKHEQSVESQGLFYGPLLSRLTAEAKGYKWYVTGRACSAGHLCERQTANGRCRDCAAETNAENCRRWYEEKGRAQVIKTAKQWVQANPEKVKATKSAHWKRKLATPQGRIKRSCRRRVVSALFANGLSKTEATAQLIGCSLEAFAAHLESQFSPEMTWENYGRTTWHIDHIRPCESFDLSCPMQRSICFNWRNQQPLGALQNIAKGAAWTPAMETEWVQHMRGLGFEGDLALVFETVKLAA